LRRGERDGKRKSKDKVENAEGKRLRDRRKWMGGIERELTRRRRKGIDLHR
jgi:hypothetical protein